MPFVINNTPLKKDIEISIPDAPGAEIPINLNNKEYMKIPIEIRTVINPINIAKFIYLSLSLDIVFVSCTKF